MTCKIVNQKKSYRKVYACDCGYIILSEIWDEKVQDSKNRCIGSGTILKDNKLPRYCPNYGQIIPMSDYAYNRTYCSSEDDLIFNYKEEPV